MTACRIESTDSKTCSRWQIGPEAPQLLLVSICVGLSFLLYHRLGAPIDPTGERSTLLWMWSRWQSSEQTCLKLYSTYGLLIPLTSVVLVWLKRNELRRARVSVSGLGMLCVALALAMHWMGVKGEHPRLSVISMVVLLFGAIWFLRGGVVARTLVFPVGFLVFIMPLNFLNGVTLKLRALVSAVAATLLSGLGMDCQTRGSALVGVGDEPFVLPFQANAFVLRDVLLLVMVGSVVAYVSQRTTLRRVVLFTTLLPLYLVSLTLIMVALGLLTQIFGPGVRQLIGDGVISLFLFIILTLVIWWLAVLLRNMTGPTASRAGGGFLP